MQPVEAANGNERGNTTGWSAWDHFVEQVPAAGFMQSSWWADFRLEADFGHFAAIVRHRGRIVGGALVLRYVSESGAIFYYIQDGPVLPGDDTLAESVFETVLRCIDEERASEAGVVSHLRIEPRWNRLPAFVEGFRIMPAFADPYTEPRDTLCIDLRGGENAVLAGMKAKGRYNVRLARRHGVTVTQDSSDSGLQAFLSIYYETAERQDMATKPDSYFGSMLELLNAHDAGSVFIARYRGEPLAAAIVVYFGERATYFFGGSRDACRNVMAPYALHFEIMRAAMSRGCRWYDMWGIAPQNASSHPWLNITRFKRKFGGLEINLAPTLDLVYDRAAYDDYIETVCDPELMGRTVQTWNEREVASADSSHARAGQLGRMTPGPTLSP